MLTSTIGEGGSCLGIIPWPHSQCTCQKIRHGNGAQVILVPNITACKQLVENVEDGLWDLQHLFKPTEEDGTSSNDHCPRSC